MISNLVMRHMGYSSPHLSRDNCRLMDKSPPEYYLPMPNSFRDALIHALQETGVSLRKVATETGVSYEQLKKIKQRATSSTNVEDALKIANFFKVPLDDFMNFKVNEITTIPIAGKVGAGASVPVFEAYEYGAGPALICPPSISNAELVAVEVEGNSMEPIYFSGDMLLYSRPTHEGIPEEAIGKICICEDLNGLGWVKQIRRGEEPGLFHLISINPGSETIWNTTLAWAAPVNLHWPKKLVRRIE